MMILTNLKSMASIVTATAIVSLASYGAPAALAQGCMPSRLATPLAGAQGDVYLPQSAWQIGIGYRSYSANQRVVGHDVFNNLPDGRPANQIGATTIDVNAEYAVSNRLALTLDIPYVRASANTWYPDLLRHRIATSGIGDVTLIAREWLRPAGLFQPGGNLSIGLGVKAPTGQYKYSVPYWQANGSVMQFPAHISTEPGDGGWGIIVQSEAFRPIHGLWYLYGAGTYTMSTKVTNGVPVAPNSPITWAVPDTWDGRAGVSYAAWPDRGLATSLGIRFDGTPMGDVFGGRDNSQRFPAVGGFVEPGLSLNMGRNNLQVTVPFRIYQDYNRSTVDMATNASGGGGMTRFMLVTSYSVRF
jgi:hypothetical protein